MAQKAPHNEENLLTKLYRRQIHGSDRYHRKARPQRLFRKIPKRLCYRLSSLVPQIVLEEGHVFLGFTKCGQFVVSYTCHMDANENTELPFYMYKLQWWWFVPSKPLIKVAEVRLFGDEDIVQDMYVLFCEWPEDHTQVLVFGHSIPGRDQESCQCYFTITAVPSLAACKACRETCSGPDDTALCLKHGFCFHTKYELTPPFPVFCPRIQLKCDGKVILNTGDSIVALHVDLDVIDEHSRIRGPFKEHSLVLKSKESGQNSSVEKTKEGVCCSPEQNVNIAPQLPLATESAQDCSNILSPTYAKLDASDFMEGCAYLEAQKENSGTSNANIGPDVRIDKCRSPRSPKNVITLNQKSPTHPLSPDKWFDCRNLTFPTSPSQNNQTNLRRVRAGGSSAEVHVAKDLYNFDSDDGEDNSYSFMCPNVPRTSLRSRSSSQDGLSHHQNLVISPNIHIQRQFGLGVNKMSPLINSQALNCVTNCDKNPDIVLTPKGHATPQRCFFSPSNSECSFGGTSSSAESVIVQVNDAHTVTHSWRKFSYHGDTEVDSTLVIEDDFDLTYRSVLPAEVRGTKNRQLSLSLDPNNDGNKEQICIKQLTFDIEHYMEEVIRGTATWGDRYVAFTNYDLQILDVFSSRNEVLAKVYALISGREDADRKKIRSGKGEEKLYQTSFTFKVNIQSGAYETLLIEDLTLLDEKDIRNKEWKPGFRECALVRRQTYIPQSSARCVHVLSNESVFKGKSLQMIMYPEHYTAIIL